jgi:succinate dehydrogenase flavin-adding protein (antitoxin of CptAB toxin-antitoxin module)
LQIKKLAWQCQRGTQELDRLLVNYLEKNYLSASFAEQEDFRQLLMLEDSQLLQLFFIEHEKDQQTLDYLVKKIRDSAAVYP